MNETPRSSFLHGALQQRTEPALEIELVREERRLPCAEVAIVLEIWTENSVYGVDGGMRCVAVVNRHTQQLYAQHAFLGARLLGGQRNEGERVFHSRPFPRPSSVAVFARGTHRRISISHTSTVQRVVLRLRETTYETSLAFPLWEDIVHEE